MLSHTLSLQYIMPCFLPLQTVENKNTSDIACFGDRFWKPPQLSRTALRSGAMWTAANKRLGSRTAKAGGSPFIGTRSRNLELPGWKSMSNPIVGHGAAERLLDLQTWYCSQPQNTQQQSNPIKLSAFLNVASEHVSQHGETQISPLFVLTANWIHLSIDPFYLWKTVATWHWLYLKVSDTVSHSPPCCDIDVIVVSTCFA